VNDLVLYCKSYQKDFLRLKRLLTSISKFNADQLPFYISTPASDKALLHELLGTQGYSWVSDESIVSLNSKFNLHQYQVIPGGISQAIVKSEFWRLRVSENYLCLDSDCVFIRPFYKNDFLTANKTPYTVLHQNKEYFQLAYNRGMSKAVINLRNEAKRVQALFGREGPLFYYAPAPFIWSAKVWESLDDQYLRPKGISLWDLVGPDYPETLIYGEALLKFQAIPLIAIEPIFRVYHYDWQYFLMRRLGEHEEKLAHNFLGVLYQSNWESSMRYGLDAKSLPSRVLKQMKQYSRYLQSYF
jgi:Family of unknown function (DUF6492)